MAHPKRKTSKTRRDKRRTHVKAEIPHVHICKETKEPHLRHHAYMVDGDLYYKGKLFSEGKDL